MHTNPRRLRSAHLLTLSKSTVAGNSVALAVALTLFGYTAMLMIFSNVTGGIIGSRVITVPIRVLIIGLLFLGFLLSGRVNRHPAVLAFLVFACLYLIRIVIEWIGESQNLYQSPVEFSYYFMAFTTLPFLLLSATEFDARLADKCRRILVFFALLFALLTINFYGSYLGQVGRITHAIGRDGAYISPLALSYQSALMIGVIAIHWVSSRTSVPQTLGLFALVLLLAVPFFLGASRGSVFALGLVLLFFLAFWPDMKRRTYFIFISACAIALAIVLQESFGDGVFVRVVNIQRDIETGSTSAIRLVMWQQGVEQFLSSPLFGNSLQHESFQHHPHNMVLEVLIATGVIGVIPFAIFLGFVFRSAIRVIRNSPERSWVVVVFLIGFASNMFSGSISAAVMTATGAGLVLAAARTGSSNLSEHRELAN